ncbi:MAG: helix-turn-helix domain-containing protein [Rhizobiales bacterium]|nr:helix-turn-helix domain-containing protein [Hyphomicrobiales bacterium]
MALREFSIGELSQRTGVNIETIRYYEKIRLLPPPPRTGGGHRVYPDAHLRRLVFIRRSRELGFTLDEIRNLLGLVEGGGACGEVRDAALAHLKNVRRKITDLRRMERTLAETAAQCEGGRAPECPIIDVLSRECLRGEHGRPRVTAEKG